MVEVHCTASPSVRGRAEPWTGAEQSRAEQSRAEQAARSDFPSQELFSLAFCLKALRSHNPLKSVLLASFRFEWGLARTDITPVNRWKREGGEAAPGQEVSALELPAHQVRIHGPGRLWGCDSSAPRGGSQDGPRFLAAKSSVPKISTQPAPGNSFHVQSLRPWPGVTGAASAARALGH